MAQRTPFPPVFWISNLLEVLERFAYYGIYFSFGIYMTSLGYSRAQLGGVQTIFLLLSYCVPLFSGALADRYGFKRMLVVSYLAYLPSILLLILTRSFSGIALTMLSIGLAAGMFKPLVSGTVKYGVVPEGLTQHVPDQGSPPALTSGRQYYLYVTADVMLPITRCLFTAP
jgi:dipeptide/tripeptide permease